MELKRAIEILDTHNKWRRGSEPKIDYSVREVGEAIDVILAEIKKLTKCK